MLKRFYADNISCLTNFELKPAQLSILVGPNGGGKSTVFHVLAALQRLLQSGSDAGTCLGFGSATRWEVRGEQRIELAVTAANEQPYEYRLQVANDRNRREATILDEQLLCNGTLIYRMERGEVQLFGDDPRPTPRTRFPVDPKRSFLPVLESRSDNQLITAFKDWFNGVFLFALRPQGMAPASPFEEPVLATDGSNFVSWFRTLIQEAPQVTDQVRNDLAPVVPGLERLRFAKLGLEAKVLLLDCAIQGKEFVLTVDELSEGQRVLLVLYTVLRAIAHKATLLVFDEPDNYVAPAEIQPWLSQMREAVLTANQGSMLVISHNPEVIDYLAADRAVFLWRDPNGPSRVRDVEIDRDRGITASEWLRLETGDGR